MSDTFSRMEIITGAARRRRFTTEQNLAVVAETMQPGCPSAMLPAAMGSRRAWRSEGGD
jgi:hypothetical protein